MARISESFKRHILGREVRIKKSAVVKFKSILEKLKVLC